MNVVFDLDGTLADISHRLHYILDDEGKPLPKKDKDWPRFFEACGDDEPIGPMVALFNTLIHEGHKIEIWSGRSSVCFDETLIWLTHHLHIQTKVCNPVVEEQLAMKAISLKNCALRMRLEGWHLNDHELKQAWLRDFKKTSYNLRTVDLAFEDRDRVVEMWRRNGVQCCQVAKGDF